MLNIVSNIIVAQRMDPMPLYSSNGYPLTSQVPSVSLQVASAPAVGTAGPQDREAHPLLTTAPIQSCRRGTHGRSHKALADRQEVLKTVTESRR